MLTRRSKAIMGLEGDFRMIATGTPIEEKIVDLHAHKRDLADSLLEGSEVSARMSLTDMLALIDDQVRAGS